MTRPSSAPVWLPNKDSLTKRSKKGSFESPCRHRRTPPCHRPGPTHLLPSFCFPFPSSTPNRKDQVEEWERVGLSYIGKRGDLCSDTGQVFAASGFLATPSSSSRVHVTGRQDKTFGGSLLIDPPRRGDTEVSGGPEGNRIVRSVPSDERLGRRRQSLTLDESPERLSTNLYLLPHPPTHSPTLHPPYYPSSKTSFQESQSFKFT